MPHTPPSPNHERQKTPIRMRLLRAPRALHGIIRPRVASISHRAVQARWKHDGFITLSGPSWINSPRIRRRVNIIWPCVTALITTCVSTILHPRIPIAPGMWETMKKKGRLISIAIFAPELLSRRPWLNIEKRGR